MGSYTHRNLFFPIKWTFLISCWFKWGFSWKKLQPVILMLLLFSNSTHELKGITQIYGKMRFFLKIQNSLCIQICKIFICSSFNLRNYSQLHVLYNWTSSIILCLPVLLKRIPFPDSIGNVAMRNYETASAIYLQICFVFGYPRSR